MLPVQTMPGQGGSDSANLRSVLAQEDEFYTWQFLAALAVGSTSVDHQRILVSELRYGVVQFER